MEFCPVFFVVNAAAPPTVTPNAGLVTTFHQGYPMQKTKKSDKKTPVTRRTMKKRQKREKRPAIEREYLTIFSPHPLPFQGLQTDEDSLEQPSALKYVPTTATPQVEAHNAK
jgi:hypothetical protein